MELSRFSQSVREAVEVAETSSVGRGQGNQPSEILATQEGLKTEGRL
jgi:hypothetical protein